MPFARQLVFVSLQEAPKVWGGCRSVWVGNSTTETREGRLEQVVGNGIVHA